MEIKIKNDGKARAQSYEAKIELMSDSSAWGYFTSILEGYGVNEYSAKCNLLEKANDLIDKLQELKKINNYE